MAAVIFAGDSFGQQLHPKKKAFQNAARWPEISPSKVKLKNFAPFRAVYDRTYKQGLGSKAGELREDRVIISAEEVGWDGRSAIAITLIDSGAKKYRDTNARVLTMFVSRSNLSVLFEIGPVPGKAKDYYIAQIDKDQVVVNSVTTQTQKLKPQKVSIERSGFGPSVWALASMARKGKQMKLLPTYSPKGNVLTSINAGYFMGKETFTDGSGKEHQAWVLETTKSFSSPQVKRLYLVDQPPYYLGTESVDLDTGEKKRSVWLRYVDLLKEGDKVEPTEKEPAFR